MVQIVDLKLTMSSVGDFRIEGAGFSQEQGGANPVYLLELMVWLAPYDIGLSQRVICAPANGGGDYSRSSKARILSVNSAARKGFSISSISSLRIPCWEMISWV